MRIVKLMLIGRISYDSEISSLPSTWHTVSNQYFSAIFFIVLIVIITITFVSVIISTVKTKFPPITQLTTSMLLYVMHFLLSEVSRQNSDQMRIIHLSFIT